MFDRQFSILKCDGENRFGFYIMVNAMRFIEDENEGVTHDTEDEVYDEDEVSEESQPTVTTE